MKHVVPFYPVICQTPKEDFFGIGKEVAGGEIISVKEKKFFDIIKEIRGQVVHSHGRGFPFPEMCSLFAKKSIYSPHNDTLGTKAYTRTIRRILFNRYSKIIVQTTYGKRKLVEQGIKEYKITVIPNPIDYKFFSSPKDGAKFREKFGIEKNEKVAISVGIRPVKNPEVIIKACEKSGIRVVLVGPKSKEDANSSWKGSDFDWYMPPKEVFDHKNVIMTGQLKPNEFLQALAGSDIFINSSDYENFGVAVYEAAASGLPMCLPNSGTFDVFKDCALFHDKKNVEELSNNIDTYLEDQNLRKSNGASSKSIAKEVDYDIVKRMFEDVYKELQ